MTNAKSNNPFDFSDVSDLPEELRSKLTVAPSKSTAAAEWAALVTKAMEFGMKSVDITQIMAAATRTEGMVVPAAQTVRGYLNAAVEQGLLTKPTRQTYAAPLPNGTKVRSKAEEAGIGAGDAVVVGEVPATVEIDPLADLGL